MSNRKRKGQEPADNEPAEKRHKAEFKKLQAAIKKQKELKKDVQAEIKELREKQKAIGDKIGELNKAKDENPVGKAQKEARMKKRLETKEKEARDKAVKYVHELLMECGHASEGSAETRKFIFETISKGIKSIKEEDYDLIGRHNIYITGHRLWYTFGDKHYGAETQDNDYESLAEYKEITPEREGGGRCEIDYKNPDTLEDWKALDPALLLGIVFLKNPPAHGVCICDAI